MSEVYEYFHTLPVLQGILINLRGCNLCCIVTIMVCIMHEHNIGPSACLGGQHVRTLHQRGVRYLDWVGIAFRPFTDPIDRIEPRIAAKVAIKLVGRLLSTAMLLRM